MEGSTEPASGARSASSGAKLAALGVPTLILWGQGDEYLPVDYAARFVGSIPGSKLVMLEGVRLFSSRTNRYAAPAR